MGIGAGTGLGGGPVPPQIRENLTTAFVETNKAALAIMPPESYEVIAFTQQQKYGRQETMSNDPVLSSPLQQMRMANLQSEGGEDQDWKPMYEQLVTTLPPLIQEFLSAENNKPFSSRNTNFVALNNVLVGAAKFMSGIENASISPAPNTPAAIRNELNSQLPAIALQGAINNFGVLLSDAKSQLSDLGANFVGHDQASSQLNQLSTLLGAFDVLSKKAAAGEDVKQTFTALSHATHQLAQGGASEFGILGAMLGTLDIIAASFALENGSPTLLIASHLANLDQSGPLSSIIGGTVQGLQDSMGSGLRAQLGELNSLQSGLRALRDG